MGDRGSLAGNSAGRAARAPGAGVADERRQDAEAEAIWLAKSASSERRPWMAVANVRRRGMGSPELSRSMQIPSLALRAFMEPALVREGLPMPREPALLTSAGRMPERSQHRVSEGHGWP